MKNSIRTLLVALAATSLASPTLANTVGTNAIQLTVTQAANSQIGVTQGGQFAIQGNGLDTVAIPTIAATGVVSAAATALTVSEDVAFSYLATIRQADIAAVGVALGTGHLDGTGTFSDLTSSSSVGDDTVGNISIASTGAASLDNTSAGAGSTTTGIISSTNAGRYAQIENRRIVSASNTQNITDSDVQQAKFSISGTGMEEITDGGFTGFTGALGTVVASSIIEGATCSSTGTSQCSTGGSFNLTQETTVSQTAETMNVTSTTLTTPAYGIVDYSAGGTTSGDTSLTDLNTVTADGGGAGTTSSLSLVSELTAFN